MIMDYSIVPELEPESDLLLENINSKIITDILEPNYGKFIFGPVTNGQAITIGNSLRRVLYSSILGTAITWVKIDGILHEYSTIKRIKESVEELLLNFKSIRIKSKSERSGKLRLEVEGEGKVCAADIMASSDFEIVNPDLHLATLDSKTSKLSVEFNIERGIGYKVKNIEEKESTIGILPVDGIFSPIRKVNYQVVKTTPSESGELENLILEIWTDSTKTPLKCIQEAANVLLTQYMIISKASEENQDDNDIESEIWRQLSPEQYNTTIEQLDLSSRTLNCLKRASLDTVGLIIETKRSDLLKIRNFGVKSFNELNDKFGNMGFLPEGFIWAANELENPEDTKED
ncbi:MAG: DNA-directed RNA polymerase subunit alpha [Chloroflexi bacterium]|nr:DNA-directed RNA polymerase subunit alpha [Chloroflexota bacterium]